MTRNPILRVTLTTIAAAAVAGALTTGAVASRVEPTPPTWNAQEHEARRSLAQGPEPQVWAVNPQEHEGHRAADAASPAGRAAIAGTCGEALAQAWQDLGHFSDAMETWMLTTPTCSIPRS